MAKSSTTSTGSNERRSGVEIPALVAAAVASVVAAVATSHFWRPGTLISTALTPVIFMLVKEWVQRPAEKIHDVARAPVMAVREAAPLHVGRNAPAPAPPPEAAREGRVLDSPPQPPRPVAPGRLVRTGDAPPPQDYERLETVLPPEGDDPAATPYRVYRPRPRRPGLRWRVAIATGLLAFVVAAVALTVPELIFGGAVTSHGSTTLWSSGSRQRSTSSEGQTTTQPSQSSTTPSSTSPSSGAPTTSGSKSSRQSTTPTTPSSTTPSSGSGSSSRSGGSTSTPKPGAAQPSGP